MAKNDNLYMTQFFRELENTAVTILKKTSGVIKTNSMLKYI